MQKALDSAQAIWAYPETKRMLSEGLSAFETVAAPAMDRLGGKSSRRSALISTVVDELIERRQSRRAAYIGLNTAAYRHRERNARVRFG